jgi:hypothetical protein
MRYKNKKKKKQLIIIKILLFVRETFLFIKLTQKEEYDVAN